MTLAYKCYHSMSLIIKKINEAGYEALISSFKLFI